MGRSIRKNPRLGPRFRNPRSGGVQEINNLLKSFRKSGMGKAESFTAYVKKKSIQPYHVCLSWDFLVGNLAHWLQ